MCETEKYRYKIKVLQKNLYCSEFASLKKR